MSFHIEGRKEWERSNKSKKEKRKNPAGVEINPRSASQLTFKNKKQTFRKWKLKEPACLQIHLLVKRGLKGPWLFSYTLTRSCSLQDSPSWVRSPAVQKLSWVFPEWSHQTQGARLPKKKNPSSGSIRNRSWIRKRKFSPYSSHWVQLILVS